MFFQINITPKEKKVLEPRTPCQTNNNYNLLLAPFQPPTRIKLDSQLKKPVECTLTIRNSNNRSLTASITKIPPQERCISLSASEWSLQPDSSVVLNILWEPRESGNWRDILQLSDSRRIKYDIPLTLTCTDPNKKADGKGGGKSKQRNPLGPKINNSSNIKKSSLTSQKPSISDNTKLVVSKSKVQPSKESKLEVAKVPNKENVSNNVGFSWMLDQARRKHEKKEPSPPPQSLDFSQLLESSTFKFTPLKSKFTGFGSNTMHDTVELNSKQRNCDIENSPRPWLLKQESSITLESKVQVTLRKETYVKIPKCLNNQSSFEITNDNADEEFDDSLSPKSFETENVKKPQSDISMLLNEIKFTPFKNKDTKNDDIKFSPNCCSTGNKSDRSKSYSDDSVNHSISKNVTFDVDKTEGNNTYELPSSPTSSKNSFHLKPTCLAKTFSKSNIDIEFSTPLPVNKNFNTTNDHPRLSSQFSKSQLDFGSARDCLEADLWVKSKNTSLSPIAKNLMHSTLDSIKEEDIHCDKNQEIKRINSAENYAAQLKKSKAVCIEISPPKKHANSKPPIRKISPTKRGRITKEKPLAETVNPKKKIQINNSIKSNKSIQIPGVKIAKLSLMSLVKDKDKCNRKSSKKQLKEVSVKLHDPNDFLSMFCNPDPFAATMTIDPFLANTLYYDDKWILVQELEFKKWLNALLTPPEHTTDIETTVIDVGKVWQSCRAREDVALAETKESVSARYHTNTRLNTLRKAAYAMFRKPDVIAALSQTTVGIEKEILIIRSDKDLHRDIGLQKTILELFISYNPLWLRIGLETIYGETIPLHSNNDLIGLSRFLLNRFFSDPFLVKTHSSHTHANIRLKTFQPLMNKFMLKKFLFLVYFLDYAKNNKLIGHDPCLFHKKALIKDSRSVLLTFSRELLSGIGDITKVLRNYNYVVSHKQTYLDEYDYAIVDLSTDLRDGVRLCRVMELITGKRSLTCQCRVPAISRLQKVHNVNVALTTLIEAGYTITGEIDAKSIADGHREKTLSLLWQIIYKFQAPRFDKAAKILQRWWRSKLWYIYIKNMLRNRKHNAASVIQRAWKCYLARQQLRILKEEYARQMQTKIEAARKLQIRWRLRREAKEQQMQYQHIKSSSIKIQRWWRRHQLTKPYVKQFKRQRKLVITVQQQWRAKQLMKIERNRFIRLKTSAIKIQMRWRACQLGRLVYKEYHNKRAAIIYIQNKYRATLLMRKEHESYLGKLVATRIIQEWWRRCLIMKRDRIYFIDLKRSVRTVEKVWIAKHTINDERKQFLEQKDKAIIIQRTWRNYQATKEDVQLYKRKKCSTLKIQSWWRSVIETKKYKNQRSNCVKIQNWWRSVVLTQEERANFLALKKSAITMQKNYKMIKVRKSYLLKKTSVRKIELWYKNIVFSRMVRNKYLQLKAAVKTTEIRWLALKAGGRARMQYIEVKVATVVLQQKWRAQVVMKRTRRDYLQMRNSALKIQSWWRMVREKQRHKERVKRNSAAIVLQRRWRAKKNGEEARKTYVKQRCSIILLQRKWRATQLAKLEKTEYLRKRQSAIVLQKNWRSFVLTRQFKLKKAAIRTIENWWINQLYGRKIRTEYLKLKNTVIVVQRLWRTKQLVKKYQKQRESIITIQKYWRYYAAQKRYKIIKQATIVIQKWRRHVLLGRQHRTSYTKFRENVIKIQRQWRTIKKRRQFVRQRKAAIVFQKHWRRFLAIKDYQKKKKAILIIEKWRKHLLHGRQKRLEYLKLKNVAIKLQRLFRVKLQVQEFRKKRHAAIKIQQFWRSIIKMRECKAQYERQKAAILTLQRRYRARRIAVQVRQNYYLQVSSIKVIQKWWRRIFYRRKLKIIIEKRKWAAVVIENWWINSSEERRILEAKKSELRRRFKAAVIIQASWRGFKIRQTACKKMSMLRERARQAAKAAVPSATLAFRLQETIEIFQYATNIGQLSVCLSSLDVITRLSPNACINVCRLNLVPKLYDVLTRANRSLPWLDVCLKDISILLTLAKFKPTTVYVLKEEYIEDLARLLTISINKKDDLFLYTATLIWILTENYEYAEAVKSCSRTRYLLASLYTSINKQLSKSITSSIKCKGNALPSPKPDWGLSHKRPRTFMSVSQAINSLASRLNILNINPGLDAHRSFNFSM